MQIASPVVSLTSTFSSIMNKEYKSATQRMLNRNFKSLAHKNKDVTVKAVKRFKATYITVVVLYCKSSLTYWESDLTKEYLIN